MTRILTIMSLLVATPMLAACASSGPSFPTTYDGEGDKAGFLKVRYECYIAAETVFERVTNYNHLPDKAERFTTCSRTKFQACLAARGYTRVYDGTGKFEILKGEGVDCRAP